MRYLSLFSGIEAATVAWEPLGWQCAAVAEIDPFCCDHLAERFPHIVNLGNVLEINPERIRDLGHIDLVVFGSPCQDLSVAGKRAGLQGARSGLFFVAMDIVRWANARFALWENVPGAFSSNGGADFAAVVGEMVGVEPDVPDGGWANSGVAIGPDGLLEWCVLDAQYFGVPQRRRRIFALRDSGDWASRPPLFLESYCLSGYPPPSRKAGQGTTVGVEIGPSGGGFTDLSPTLDARCKDGFIRNQLGVGAACYGGANPNPIDVATTVNAHGVRMDFESETFVCRGISDYGAGMPSLRAKGADCAGGSETFVTHALRADGFDASEDGTGRGTPLVPVSTFQNTGHGWWNESDVATTVRTPEGGGSMEANVVVANTLGANAGRNQIEQNYIPILEAGARTGTSTTDPRAGIGIGEPGDPMFTLQSGKQHAVAFTNQWGDESETFSTLKSGCHGALPMVAFSCKDHGADASEIAPTLRSMSHDDSHANGGGQVAVALCEGAHGITEMDVTTSLQSQGGKAGQGYQAVRTEMAVRRLTPRECERLQGFPDGWTLITYRGKPAADGPRYKAIGNSMAVPVMRWIGERIAEVEAL